MPEDTPNTPADGAAPGASAPADQTIAGGPPNPSAQAPGRNAAESLAEEALRAAQQAVEKIGAPSGAGDASTPPREFVPQSLSDSAAPTAPAGLDLLSDVNLNVKIELGRTRMFVEDVLRLSEGAVVELDKSAGDPVDIYVNDRHVARGEVLILNDNFCVRVSEVLAALPAG